MTVFMVILGIGFLIFIHEFGHYICARLAGVHVEVFSLGFGHRVGGFVWRGTDYRLSLIPFGGYVRVSGDDPTQRHNLHPDDLQSKSFSARFFFYSGGVLMNLLFALVMFPLVFKHGVDFLAPRIGAVTAGSPAWEADLRRGDRIVSLDGQPMYDFRNLQMEVALASDRDIALEIERDGVTLTKIVRPRYSNAQGIFHLGISPATADAHPEVHDVDPKSPAYRQGIRDGDRVTRFGGEAHTGLAAIEAIQDIEATPGAPVALTLQRGDGDETFEATFTPQSTREARALVGVMLAPRVVAGIRPGCATVERLGIRRGDVVERVDGAPFGGRPADEAPETGPFTLDVVRAGERIRLATPATATERAEFFEHVAFEGDVESVHVVPQADSPAMRAGIQTGDLVVAIDGAKVSTWSDLVDAVSGAGETALRFAVVRGGSEQSVEVLVTPARREIADLGFSASVPYATQKYQIDSFSGAVAAGCVASVDLIQQLYVTLRRIFRGDVSAKNLGGIVTISRASYHYAERGWAVFLYFLALLSINLAFINVLPIPVLDGGHLLFLLIEKVKGSPVSTQVMTYSQVLGMVFVIALMLFVTYNDILRLF